MIRNKYYSPFVLILGLIILLFGFSYISSFSRSDIDSKMDFNSVFGNKVDLSTVSGPYIVHFFSSWCKACVVDHNIIMKHMTFLPIYAVASFDDAEKIKQYLSKNKNPYVDVIHDPQGVLTRHFNVSGLPETLLIKKNKISLRIKGSVTLNDLEKKIIPFFESS